MFTFFTGLPRDSSKGLSHSTQLLLLATAAASTSYIKSRNSGEMEGGFESCIHSFLQPASCGAAFPRTALNAAQKSKDKSDHVMVLQLVAKAGPQVLPVSRPPWSPSFLLTKHQDGGSPAGWICSSQLRKESPNLKVLFIGIHSSFSESVHQSVTASE